MSARLFVTTLILQVVDLLIAMANAAANSPRVNVILDPFPSIVDPAIPDRLAMDPKVPCDPCQVNALSVLQV